MEFTAMEKLLFDNQTPLNKWGRLFFAAFAVLIFNLPPYMAAVHANSFTYQGRLTEDGQLANGRYDFRFRFFPNADEESFAVGELTVGDVGVSNGLFTAELDFGNGIFAEPELWLEIAVKKREADEFIVQRPRQRLTAAPWANHANTAELALLASNVAPESITASALAPASIQASHMQLGIIGPEHLVPGTFLTNDYADTIRAAAFAGDGSLLTGIVAASANAGFTNVIVVPSATGNAATDTANLQWALDQTTNNGVSYWGGNVEVFIPAGDYRVNDSLILKMQGTRVRGAGRERTRLWMTVHDKDLFRWQGVPGLSYGGTNAAWFVCIEDITLRKPEAPWTVSRSSGINWTAPHSGQQNLSRGFFKNLSITGFFYGMRFNHSVGVLCENVEVYGNNHGFYCEKADSATFINCFAGDGYRLDTGKNRFGTNYSTGWTYKSSGTSGGTAGFSLAILGGEGRGCNTLFDIQSGQFSLQNFNVERMYDGPVIRLGSSLWGARIQNVTFRGRAATNRHPNIRFEGNTGQRTVIDSCTFSDSSTAPHLAFSSAADFVHYRGLAVQATNTATARNFTLYSAPMFTNAPSPGDIPYATSTGMAKWAAPPVSGGDKTTNGWVIVAGTAIQVATNGSAHIISADTNILATCDWIQKQIPSTNGFITLDEVPPIPSTNGFIGQIEATNAAKGWLQWTNIPPSAGYKFTTAPGVLGIEYEETGLGLRLAESGDIVDVSFIRGFGTLLKELNAGELKTGTVPPARLATNTPVTGLVLYATSDVTAKWDDPPTANGGTATNLIQVNAGTGIIVQTNHLDRTVHADTNLLATRNWTQTQMPITNGFIGLQEATNAALGVLSGGDGRGLTNIPITALVSLTNQFTGTMADFAVPESLVSLAGDLAFTGVTNTTAGRVERTIITLLSGGANRVITPPAE